MKSENLENVLQIAELLSDLMTNKNPSIISLMA